MVRSPGFCMFTGVSFHFLPNLKLLTAFLMNSMPSYKNIGGLFSLIGLPMHFQCNTEWQVAMWGHTYMWSASGAFAWPFGCVRGRGGFWAGVIWSCSNLQLRLREGETCLQSWKPDFNHWYKQNVICLTQTILSQTNKICGQLLEIFLSKQYFK